MSTAEPNYEQLLRQAIQQAKNTAPPADTDLHLFSSKAAEAVDRVTGGAVALDLVPINRGDGSAKVYQLQLRKVKSKSQPSDLGIYQVFAAGYHLRRWNSREQWMTNPEKPDLELWKPHTLRRDFELLVSEPESKLVVLVTYLQEQNRASTETAATS